MANDDPVVDASLCGKQLLAKKSYDKTMVIKPYMQSLSDLTAVYMTPAGTATCQPSVILQPLQQLYTV